MHGTAATGAPILILTDNPSDATLLRRLLDPEFTQLRESTVAANLVADFEHTPPAVIVLAYGTLEKSESTYLALYRLSAMTGTQRHRTIVLCNKDNVGRTYDACRRQLFDDYVLFWPMNYDSRRLAMSIHLALRALAAGEPAAPTVAQFAVQARRLSGLDQMLQEHAGEALQRALTPQVEAAKALGALADAVKPTVLVVDDDEFMCTLLAKMLAGAGYKPMIAYSGADVFHVLRHHRPDLIVMDVLMPGMNGIDIARRLKASPTLAAIPLIIVTGNSEGTTVKDSMQAGAIDFVVKPVERELFLRKVAHALSPATLARDVGKPPS
jgi:CheY-like chemotaxis protein